MDTRRWSWAILAIALTASATVATTAAASTPTSEPVTLTMAHRWALAPPAVHLQEGVAERSGGVLVIEPAQIDRTLHEQEIVAGVAAGFFDLGLVGTRAFAGLGVASFDALTAPMLIDSYVLEQAVLDSDIPERMLAGVEALGVIGLAVIGGGLGKPFAANGALLAPDDFAGLTIRTYRSHGHAAAIKALGAGHVDDLVPDSGLAEGRIHGLENTIAWYEEIDARQTPYIAINVNLWPHTMVLIANPDSLARLTGEQSGWLGDAIAETVARSTELSNIDAAKLDTICGWGARLFEASDADLDAFRAAFDPVYAGLAENDETAAFIAEIETLKDVVGGDEPLTIPEGCTGQPPAAAAEGTDDPSVLDGTYRIERTRDELVAAGVPEAYWDRTDVPDLAGTITWTFDAGVLTQLARGGQCTGTYGVTGDVVDIQWEAPCRVSRFTATWEITGTELVFSNTLLDGQPNPVLEAWLAGKPWERVE